MQPVSETLFASNAWIKGIGIATNYDRVENIPDGGTVQRSRLADLEHLLLRGLTTKLSGRGSLVNAAAPVHGPLERVVRRHSRLPMVTRAWEGAEFHMAGTPEQ